MQVSWQYATMSGTVVAASAPLALVPGFGLLDQAMPTLVTWHGGWSALLDTGPLDNLQCSVAVDLLTQPQSATALPLSGLSVSAYPAANPLDGCFMDVQVSNNQATPTTGTGHFLYRFGALLAADATAHAMAPSLPVASQHERALVQAALADNP